MACPLTFYVLDFNNKNNVGKYLVYSDIFNSNIFPRPHRNSVYEETFQFKCEICDFKSKAIQKVKIYLIDDHYKKIELKILIIN